MTMGGGVRAVCLCSADEPAGCVSAAAGPVGELSAGRGYAGWALGAAIREIVLEVEAEWEQQLGTREFGQLRRLLTQLHAIATPSVQPA